jgi:hypothetical protein
VKLRWPDAVFLFIIGAAASLVGDHSHVALATVIGIYVTTALVHTGPRYISRSGWLSRCWPR